MKSSADMQIRLIFEMSNRMIALSVKGFASCDDDGCLLLNGMVRECAYRLRDAAEQEMEVHRTKGSRGGRNAVPTVSKQFSKRPRPSKVRSEAP